MERKRYPLRTVMGFAKSGVARMEPTVGAKRRPVAQSGNGCSGGPRISQELHPGYGHRTVMGFAKRSTHPASYDSIFSLFLPRWGMRGMISIARAETVAIAE
jgi:hypothetical protein